MAFESGDNFLVYVAADGASTPAGSAWRLVDGQDNATLNNGRNNYAINHKTSGGWELNVAGRIKKLNLQISGYPDHADTDGWGVVEAANATGTGIVWGYIRLNAAGEGWIAKFVVADLNYNAPTDGPETYTFALNLASTPTVVTETPAGLAE